MKKEIISEKELTFVLANVIITKMIFSFPRNLFFESGNAAWLEAVFVSLFATVVFEITASIYAKCDKQSILELSEHLGGKLFKSAVAILTVLVLSLNFTAELRTFSESVKIVLLPKTNIEYIMILLAIAIVIGAKKGISAISTINAILFPICLVFLAFIAIFLLRDYRINNIFPILGTGVKNIVKGGFRDLSCFSDVLILNLLLPYTKDLSVTKKSGRKAVIISSVTIIMICLCYGLCYPYERAKEFLLPIYQLSRMIRAGEYFQRFEAFFEFVWTVTELLYGTIYVYVICNTISEAFNVKNQNMLVYCVVTSCIFIALMPSSVVENVEFSQKIGIWTAPVAFLLPFILPLIYLPKRRTLP